MRNWKEPALPPPPAKDGVDYANLRVQTMQEMIELGFSDAEALAEAKAAEARARARIAYIDALKDRFIAANRAVDDAWDKRFEAHPEWLEDTDEAEDALEALPDPPEQQAVDDIFAELEGIIEHDAWPRHLHFHAV